MRGVADQLDPPITDNLQPFFTTAIDDGFWSMRPWESARPLEKVGRGSESQGRMDQKPSSMAGVEKG
jgi:hypothetical protein